MPNPTTRAVFGLGGRQMLYFNDQRKFGWIRILHTAELQADPFLARLGPEPLDDEFSLPVFRAQLAPHPRSQIKATLLNQSTVAGLGNIYTDEALHRARIHPRRRCAELTNDELRRLHTAIRATRSRTAAPASPATSTTSADVAATWPATVGYSAGPGNPAPNAAPRSSGSRSPAAAPICARTASPNRTPRSRSHLQICSARWPSTAVIKVGRIRDAGAQPDWLSSSGTNDTATTGTPAMLSCFTTAARALLRSESIRAT